MPTEILMPALSPTMEEGTLAKWLVKEGDMVRSGDLLAEIETDKATMEFEAVDEGVIGKLLVAEGTERVKVNAPIAVILSDGEKASMATAPSSVPAGPFSDSIAKSAAKPSDEQMENVASRDNSRLFSSPLARRIAKAKGLDLASIKGTGPHGRVVKADVESAAAAPKSVGTPDATSATSAPSEPSAEAVIKLYADRETEEVKLDGMRKIIAARLTEAKQTIPHFYLRRDIRLDALMSLRNDLNAQLESRKIKLSINDFVIKASALALQAVPDANAIWAGDRIIRLKPSDVAVAVSIEGGLFTPVLRDAHLKSISTLSAEMKDLATRARNRKLAPHEYQGGSFAISNLGMFGIDNFDAVINPPHGSILAVGAGARKPVVNEAGEIAIATVMSVTLSVDHRVIDGALGAEFLSAIKDNLENPIAMLA